MGPRCWIGTSGWVYPHWRGVFYPEDLPQRRWFSYYAAHFDTVEINNAFYRLPSEATFDRWRDQAPEGFRYAVKANRYLTHVRRLKDCADPLARFLERARRLGDRLGPILYQLPPGWPPDPGRLAEFAALLPPDMLHGFELRDPRWWIEPVREVLARGALSFCLFDMPELSPPLWVTGPVVYIRFHGSTALYAGRYAREALAAWAERIRGFLRAGHEVYAYFNNDAFGHAVINAVELREMLG
ncbi:DUF72 domain-containing protein [Thermoflexus sp.]|uniref:DUF72 domain-containing protein n=1 Tax=Thermoflexus sp. TaxID=1969742 RepID=UPI003C1138F6